MSGPAVVIGYIFLVPSVLGMLFSALMFLVSLSAAGGDDKGGAGVAVIGGGFAIFTGLVCFIGGLVGWLLVMKKRVLQCSVCSAVVNAS